MSDTQIINYVQTLPQTYMEFLKLMAEMGTLLGNGALRVGDLAVTGASGFAGFINDTVNKRNMTAAQEIYDADAKGDKTYMAVLSDDNAKLYNKFLTDENVNYMIVNAGEDKNVLILNQSNLGVLERVNERIQLEQGLMRESIPETFYLHNKDSEYREISGFDKYSIELFRAYASKADEDFSYTIEDKNGKNPVVVTTDKDYDKVLRVMNDVIKTTENKDYDKYKEKMDVIFESKENFKKDLNDIPEGTVIFDGRNTQDRIEITDSKVLVYKDGEVSKYINKGDLTANAFFKENKNKFKKPHVFLKEHIDDINKDMDIVGMDITKRKDNFTIIQDGEEVVKFDNGVLNIDGKEYKDLKEGNKVFQDKIKDIKDFEFTSDSALLYALDKRNKNVDLNFTGQEDPKQREGWDKQSVKEGVKLNDEFNVREFVLSDDLSSLDKKIIDAKEKLKEKQKEQKDKTRTKEEFVK